MKKLFSLLFIVSIFAVCYIYKKDIVNYIVNAVTAFNRDTSTIKNNDYAHNNDYEFVKLTNDFSPTSKEDIINIYYTVLNSGMKEFTFYCDDNYKNCLEDIDYVSNNQNLLSNLNNFVPVYNSFSNIETEFDSLGKITIHINHNYTEEQITVLKEKVKIIVKELITNGMKDEQKIKLIHDYIINNTKYDIDRSDNKIIKYESDNAYGALIQNYAICGGYADSMKLFLDYLSIPNYKISSENHVWNLVYVNNDWYHLDLTWDDPVTSTGRDVLEYDYFLITSDELKAMNTDQHVFDKSTYSEAL